MARSPSVSWMERVAGIEPASQAWEACALPLDDTRLMLFLPNSLTPVNTVSKPVQKHGIVTQPSRVPSRHCRTRINLPASRPV